ncbi:MAG: glycosyltransferase [Geobacteraceae bacterium]
MGIANDMRLAVLYDRMGPYHHARMDALCRRVDLTAVEFSTIDETYAWDLIKETGAYRRVTLFSDKPIGMHSSTSVAARVKGVLNELRPQVVAIPGWDAPAALIALQWCLETGTPSVLLSDSQKSDQKRVWWKELAKGRIARLHSAGFVGGAPHVAYLTSLGMPESRISTGCDVVDNDYFAAEAEAARQNESTRERLGLPRAYFLASGRFVEKKNLPLLLHAYADYLAKAGDSAWDLVLIGDGPLKPQLMVLRKELRLDNNVILPGFKQYAELPTYYGLAGAFVHASTSEQWGLVVNEAMACCLPVIVSSPCGCVPELVRNGHNGFVFNPYDREELSRCLSYVAGVECDRKAMGKAGRAIIEKLSPTSYAENLCKVAAMALAASRPLFGCVDKVILESLIHRRRS